VNKRHQKTLALIFSKPTPKTLEWRSIEALFVALGCDIIEGSGSSVSFTKNGHVAYFHRPHPQKEAKPYQVKAAKEFCLTIGVKP
jgi:hypothetical protein